MHEDHLSNHTTWGNFLYQKPMAYLFFALSFVFIAFISYHFYLEHPLHTSYNLSLVIGSIGLTLNILFITIFLALINNRQ
ncbi:MAG TPA: hypothetical protein VFX57_05950, partial [Sulfuricurvum sp.]|nr:hypothetical protein [Sulfuricurvum sp.]